MNPEWTSTERCKPKRYVMVKRAIALLMCELIVLQPAMAQLSQIPMFTVTSVPPNVMLTFDDSASMQLLTLNPVDDTHTMSISHSSAPVVKINTQGYFGISGFKHYVAGTDGRWSFGVAEVKRRSAAFNPLAYNPANRYRPWNNNGTRMADANYGGSGVVAAGTTEWDMRNLPAAMGGGTVRSKLTLPNSGNLPSGSTLRSWAAPVPGSVRYNGLPHGSSAGMPVTQTAPAGVDLFNHTITWRSPTCNAWNTPYSWVCTSGSAATPPTDACNVGNVGNPSVDGTCCTAFSAPFPDTRVATRNMTFGIGEYPNGSPPPTPSVIYGTAGETCTARTWLSQTLTNIPGTCVTPPPEVAPCPGGGGELCVTQPPDVCDTGYRHTWRCTFNQDFMNQTCESTIARTCTAGSSSCTGWAAPGPTDSAIYVNGYWPAARYVVYDGPQPGTVAQRQNLSNYRMVMISRKFGWNSGTTSRDLIGTNLQDAVSKWYVVDAVSGLPSYRPDCAVLPSQDGTWCTFEQEAQNYANWFTYYRSRLYAAVAVSSEILAGFTGPEQYMRLGFARINYFKGALNPWNVNSVTDIPYPGALPDLDTVANEGAVVRGVRSFTVFDPPLSAIPNPARQEMFNQLFSVNGLGPTPNRETAHAVGQYFKRTDSRGPWGLNPGTGTEPASEHLWCRRNYNVLATDGEWTKLDPIGAFEPQRLLERASDWSADPVAAGATTSMSTSGPLIAGTERLTNAPLSFTYVPGDEPQITGGSGAQNGTLTDVMHYYWSRDLRSDLRNSLDVTPTNRAFWQHLATYVVGYGVNASMEAPPLRPQFNARNLIAWPTVGLEACRQLDDNAQDALLNPQRPTPCVYSVTPSGNRINDTLRAGLSSHGDFFSANSPDQLRAALDAVFSAISAENAAGTVPAFSSPSVAAGGLLVQSGFRTNVWDGYMWAYDTKAYLDFLAGGAEPPKVWTLNIPDHASRNIITATAQATAVAFEWCNLSAAQRTDIDPVASADPCAMGSNIHAYLRGNQTMERRFPSGVFRDRRDTVLGDIVNSSPLYSKAADYANRFKSAAGHSAAPPHGFESYPAYVNTKKTTRTATVMFGANDGMFHIVDARQGEPTSGQELFAYVPRAVYPRLRELSDPAYSHKYTVDGPIVEGDVWVGGQWKTIVVGSTGAGPAGLFALDVTRPQDGLGAANVLWDIVPADHASAEVQQHLGNVLGMGVIGSVKLDADSNPATLPNGKWAFIVGNGYGSANHQATLLVFDAMDGSLIRSIQTGVGAAGSRNGLGAVAPVYDGSRNIVGVYAGDRLGNLWKFDLSSSDPANWKIANEQPAGTPAPLLALGATRPIHQEPRVVAHPLGGLYVAVGTGRLHEVGDIGDTSDQGLFVVWDKGQLAPIALGDLEMLRLEEYTVGSDVYRRLRAADLAQYDWNDKGFWIRLRPHMAAANGERIIAPMIVDLGVLSVTSYAPESGTDPCIPGGTSFLYRIDLAGGFKNGSFGNEGATTVGLQLRPGTASAMMPLHEPVDYGPGVVETMSAAEVKTMLSTPKYRLSGGTAVNLDGVGPCVNVGLRVDGTFARIPVNCAGTLPMRTWRPVR
jgi:type IV pilus assembly protein PilY1